MSRPRLAAAGVVLAIATLGACGSTAPATAPAAVGTGTGAAAACVKDMLKLVTPGRLTTASTR